VQDLLQRQFKSSKEDIKEIQLQINELLAMKVLSKKEDDTKDIDKRIEKLEEKISQLEDALNLENMLTWLDGTVEMRNRVIIAATNCIDTIVPALIRDGRFDVKLCLEEFNNEEIREILILMYGAQHAEFINSHTYKEKTYTPVRIINIAAQYNDIYRVIAEMSVSSDHSKND
jgi:SpoVK/Ycf46/Vps4 family AAA+-type ATPase